MNIHSICLRKKLLGGLTEKWGSPLSVHAFIDANPDEEKREAILRSAEDIVFFDSDQTELPYAEGITLYRKDEAFILDALMTRTMRANNLKTGLG